MREQAVELDVEVVVEVLKSEIGDRIYWWHDGSNSESIDDIALDFVRKYTEMALTP